MPRPHTKAATPNTESSEEVALTPRQQSALQAGLHEMSVSNVSIDFNQRLIGALLSGRDMRPWQEQVGTRLRWMLPGVLAGFGVTLALIYRQNLPQQAAAEKLAFPAFSTVAPPLMPPMPMRIINAAKTDFVVTPPVLRVGKEAHHESP